MSARSAADDAVTLDIAILGRDFRIACKENEREELLTAVSLLDARMREIRDAGKVSGVDRIAVMAALNIAHDLLRERRRNGAIAGTEPPSAIDGESARRRIRAMQTAIEQTLASQEKLF